MMNTRTKALRRILYAAVAYIFLFSIAPCYAGNNALKLISSTCPDGALYVSISDTITFEFNNRLDPCDNSFSVSGGDIDMQSYNIDGNKLTLYLTSTMAYDTEYTVDLNGLSDLYGNMYDTLAIRFRTMPKPQSNPYLQDIYFADGDGIIISSLSNEKTVYKGTLINNENKNRDLWFVMAAYSNSCMEKLNIKKITLEPNSILELNESLESIPENSLVKVFYTDDNLSAYPSLYSLTVSDRLSGD